MVEIVLVNKLEYFWKKLVVVTDFLVHMLDVLVLKFFFGSPEI